MREQTMETITEPGLYPIGIEEYHAQPGISKSGLTEFAISPKQFAYSRAHSKKKRAFDVGNAAHVLVLEPDEFDKRVATPPKDVLAKNGAMSTNAFHVWAAKRRGAYILSKQEMTHVEGMRTAVAESKAGKLFKSGYAELSGFYEHETLSGRKIWVKFRPDFIPDNLRLGDTDDSPLEYCAVDLKTCRDAREAVFFNDCAKMNYHWSAYITLTGLSVVSGVEHDTYYFVAVQKTPPHHVGFYRILRDSPEWDKAAEEVEAALDDYAVCLERGDFSKGLAEGVQDVRFSKWRLMAE